MDILKLKDWFIDLIFPKECISCGLEETYLCHTCFKRLELNKQFYCVLCKKQTNHSQICENCKKKTALKAVFVVADYNNQILQNLLHNLKYNFVEEISDYLGDLIIRYLKANNILKIFQINFDNTIICPVPLHKKRYLARGFNQSELLAQKLSVYYKIPTRNLLIRQINTMSQVNLNRQERQTNLKNAFIFNNQESIKNKKILLIDDVVTTGSTLIESAQALEQKGFSEIYGLVIAQRED
ncbi:MAG: hypothetical protein GF365_01215|nr:hypothetical protein [Candidatus Buchananbacteria bacterium]